MKFYSLIFLILLATFCSSNSDTNFEKNDTMKSLLRTGNNILIENRVFEEAIDFTSLLDSNLISEGIYQAKTASSITFRNCRFEGKLSGYNNTKASRVINTSFLSNVSFLQCIFNNEVTFRGSSICGIADFTKSTFNKRANFEECTFLQNAFFNGCSFNEEVRFQNAFFMKRANFMNTSFAKNASFQNVTFNSEVQFAVSKFQDYADFSLTKYNDNVYFNYGVFEKNANFNTAHFARGADFLNGSFNNAEFNASVFYGESRFFHSAVKGTLDFDKCFFLFGTPDLSYLARQKINLNNLRKAKH